MKFTTLCVPILALLLADNNVNAIVSHNRHKSISKKTDIEEAGEQDLESLMDKYDQKESEAKNPKKVKV